MKKEDLMTKANAILSSLQAYNFMEFAESGKSSDILSIQELEFKHLVYNFDPNLPLNDYLKKEILLPFGHIPNENNIKTLIHYVEFFLSRVDNLPEDVDYEALAASLNI